MPGELIDEAARQAVEVLRRCATPRGLTASGTADGYPEVWARDAMIATLGIAAAGLDELAPAVHASLATLAGSRSEVGRIPTNVLADGRPTTDNAGGVDGNLWFLVGQRVADASFGPQPDRDGARAAAIVDALRWVRYQDSDDDGLLESQEASNWADLLAYRGKVLADNALYRLALLAYAGLAEGRGLPDAAAARARSALVAERLDALHWVDAPRGLWQAAGSPALQGEHREAQRLAELTSVQLWHRPFYLPWVGFRAYGDWCDVLGNLLAILARVPDAARTGEILDHLDAVGAAEPWPARAIDPPIRPGDLDWRDYYRNNGLSLPDQYHNGGAWPFIGGFLVCALIHAGRTAAAVTTLERLATCVREGRGSAWEFNEWYHGRTGRPMGRPHAAWSAAMYLAAHRAVTTGRSAWLDAVVGD